MADIHEIKLDNEGLCRFKKREHLGSLLVVLPLVFMFIGLITALPKENKQGRRPDVEMENLPQRLLVGTGIGCGLGVVCGLVTQLLLVRPIAKRFTAAYRVSVEGPYLRVVSHDWNYLDQKVHFRNLDNYAIFQSPAMRRAGIKSIRINHDGLGANRPMRYIEVLAPVDPEKTRDTLAALDDQREGMSG